MWSKSTPRTPPSSLPSPETASDSEISPLSFASTWSPVKDKVSGVLAETWKGPGAGPFAEEGGRLSGSRIFRWGETGLSASNAMMNAENVDEEGGQWDDPLDIDMSERPSFAETVPMEAFVDVDPQLLPFMEVYAPRISDIDRGFPAPDGLSPIEKLKIIAQMGMEERNWDKIKPADIVVSPAEVGMWGGFMGEAKEGDFNEFTSVSRFSKGEIMSFEIIGFDYFRIVKIRKNDKVGKALSVIEFQRTDNGQKGRGNFFISFPIAKEGYISLFRKENPDGLVAKYRIRSLSINKEHAKNLGWLLN